MSLQDCAIATSTETIDPTMLTGAVAISGAIVTSGTVQAAAITATWVAIPNPYVGGIIFEYGPLDGSVGKITTAVQSAGLLAWAATDGIVSGKPYTIRYRASSADMSVKGAWSMAQTVNGGVLYGTPPAEPGATAWTGTGTTVTSGGVSLPAVVLTGAVDADGVVDFFVEFADHGATNWTGFGTYAPATTRVIIDSVGSTGVIDIGITYLGAGGASVRRVINNGGAGYTAGAFNTGVTPDPTPAAVNWADMATMSAGIPVSSSNADQMITGINEPITLKLTWTGAATMQYVLNSGSPTAITSGSTFVVNNGDNVHFIASYNVAAHTSGTATVTNVTDSNTVLDTFAYDLTGTTVVADGTQQIITATGAFSFPVPANWLGFVDIEGYAGGEGGGIGSYSGGGKGGAGGYYPGLGGGGGGYFKHHIAVVPGTTVIAGVVGAASAASANTSPNATPGGDTTVTSPALTAHGGHLSSGLGAGGTATGGNIANVTGHNGSLTNLWDGGGASGHADQTAQASSGTIPGGGGAGGGFAAGAAGADGQIIITARTI